MRPALIAVSFGTSYPETRRKTIGAVEAQLAAAFPDYDLFRAFTSTVVIKKIAEQEGVTVPTVAQKMSELIMQGYDEIYIQPLHIIAGIEYSRALHQAMMFKDQVRSIKVGKPLLNSIEDYKQVIAWLDSLAVGLQAEEAIVLMGHGSQHAAFTAYACLDHMLSEKPIFISAVESYPEIDVLLERLQASHYKEIKLYPLMLVAGDHATNDMASEDKDSWKSKLEQAGFTVEAHLKGMGEFPQIQQQFIDHAAAMMSGATHG